MCKIHEGGIMNKVDKQKYIDALSRYAENQDLTEFDIFHMYGKGYTNGNGYHDSNFFDLHLFNTKKMEKRILKERDGISFDNAKIIQMRIYLDKSTFVKLSGMHKVLIHQDCVIYRSEARRNEAYPTNP